MIGDERQRNLVIGFLVSIAIHIPAAAIAIWPGGPRLHASVTDSRKPVVEARSQSGTPARSHSSVNGSAPQDRTDRTERPPDESSSRRIAPERRARLSPREDRPNGVSSAFVRGAGRSTGSERPLDRDTATAPALVSSFDSGGGKWIDHLWQSTAFAVVAGLLTLAFRRNRASVRYWVWFSASVKFFVPFALLVNLGSQLQWAPAAQEMAERAFSVTIERISQPFPDRWTSGLSSAVSTQPNSPSWLSSAILGVWVSGFVAISLIRLRMWRRIRATVRASTRVEIRDAAIPASVQVRTASGLLEPGVVGFRRPILLLPAGIDAHLTPAQLRTVVAHELCHIKRRDNLTAAIHMIVEAVFWFHPLVWWIGSRLVEERERACDEDVLRSVGDPRAYAEGILNVCKRYVDAQLACVSGVSGADLKKRIEAIMRNQDGDLLGAGKKLLLVAAGIATVAIPIAIGTLSAPLLGAQSATAAAVGSAAGPSFETASIKLNVSRPGPSRLEFQPGGRLNGINVTAASLIRFAYDRADFQVFGGPDWLDSVRFDVVAKAEGDPPVAEKRLLLRRLLAERFKLIVHTENRDLPYYAMVLARSDGRLGPQLKHSQADCSRAAEPFEPGIGLDPDRPPSCGFFGFAPGTNFAAARGGIAFRGLTMAALAKVFVPMVERSVIDQTGLTGYFDAEFDFIAELPIPPPGPGIPPPTFDPPLVSVFSVLPEQLGLKLDSRRGPVEILVIDGAEQPTPN